MRRGLRITLLIALLAGLLFGCAGRVDLPFFWAWIAIPVVTAAFLVRHIDPGLMRERLRPGQGGTDRRLRMILTPFWLAHIVIAALDVGRFHWSDDVPLALQLVGLIGFAATHALAGWAMWVNRFFSPVVRIQSERGHVLVTDGPYRWVRHPGYTGILIGLPFGGVALGSWWSLVPMIPVFLLVLRRTLIEDRFLWRYLAGYVEYAQRVRYRLVPGVW